MEEEVSSIDSKGSPQPQEQLLSIQPFSLYTPIDSQ